MVMEGEDFIPFAAKTGGEAESGSKTGTEERQADELFALPALITDFPAPWLQCSEPPVEVSSTSKSSSFVRLHNEMLMFCDFISPTQAELAARDRVLSDVKQVVKELWPKAKVRIFGSQLTRILTPTSDIDMVVLDVPTDEVMADYEYGDSSRCISELHDLDAAIRKNKLASYCEVISSAKVPIVKYDDKKSGVSVDICINNDSGLSTGKMIRRFVREYPQLRPLVMVLKVFLVCNTLLQITSECYLYTCICDCSDKLSLSFVPFDPTMTVPFYIYIQSQRRLNETYSGGMGSFVLVSIVVSFLQMREKTARYRGVSLTSNLGALLLDFFALYGGSFNFVHTGISITNGGSYFQKLDRTGWFNPSRLADGFLYDNE
jgi:non-canonical poly(A) RNA polymerase PAPD5/7